ncbi:CNP1-like family protein, partial [Neisseria gonorrhoeae]
MRRAILLILTLTVGTSLAAGFSQKDTPINTRYRETPEEAAAREFKEHTAELPPLPDAHSDGWFDIYVDENYGKQPKILLDSLQIMPAPDGSIRYILNIRSDKGYDNLT